MKNQPKNCEKNLEILADLILRLQFKKRWLIDRISLNLWKHHKRARNVIYSRLFNQREISLLVTAYALTIRSLEGHKYFPDLNIVFEFDYQSLIELEQLMASLHDGELNILPAGKILMNKYNFSAVWPEQLCSEQNLASLIKDRLNAILDKSLTSLHESLKYQVLNRSYDKGGCYEQVIS